MDIPVPGDGGCANRKSPGPWPALPGRAPVMRGGYDDLGIHWRRPLQADTPAHGAQNCVFPQPLVIYQWHLGERSWANAHVPVL